MTKTAFLQSVGLVALGFGSGVVVTAMAGSEAAADRAIDPAAKRFRVSIDEVAQNFVFGEYFQGEYRRQVTMQDQSVRDIRLTPMLKDGRLVVRFDDTGGHTFMGPNGSTTNGRLLVQLRDLDQIDAEIARLQASDDPE